MKMKRTGRGEANDTTGATPKKDVASLSSLTLEGAPKRFGAIECSHDIAIGVDYG